MDLLTGEHGGKGVVIFGPDLREECPVAMLEDVDKKHPGCGEGLTDGLWRPMLLELYEEKVVAKLSLGDRGWIAAEVLVDKPELAVVGVPRSIGVVTQGQVVGKPSHGRVRMLVVDRVRIVSRDGPNGGQGLGRPRVRVGDVSVGFVSIR